MLLATVGLVMWTRGAATQAEDDVITPDMLDVQWPVQLTTNPGLDLHPALSPQGDAVAYVSDRVARTRSTCARQPNIWMLKNSCRITSATIPLNATRLSHPHTAVNSDG